MKYTVQDTINFNPILMQEKKNVPVADKVEKLNRHHRRMFAKLKRLKRI